MWGKIISLIISIVYLVISFNIGGIVVFLRILGFLILPLSCIWFSEIMGEYTGFLHGEIAQESPGCMVAFVGWILLFVPVVIFLIGLCM